MSVRRVVLPKGLVALRTSAPSVPRDPSQAPEAAPPASQEAVAGPLGLATRELKSLQRRAFERGREVERETASGVLAAAAAAFDAARRSLAAARAGDRETIEEFAIRLACVIAEELTGSLIERNLHDARAIARRVLDEALPELDGAEAAFEAHPDDLALIAPHLAAGGAPPSLALVPNPLLARGSFRVAGGGMELYSGLRERLDAMRQSLLSGGPDPAGPGATERR